jgi:hypothetical protein
VRTRPLILIADDNFEALAEKLAEALPIRGLQA